MHRAILALLGCTLGALPAAAQQSAQYTEVEIVGHVVEPTPLQPTEEPVSQLKVPDGFDIEEFADGLIIPA